MTEFGYNPFMVNVWIKQIGPVNKDLISKIAVGGPVWARQPYRQEVGIVSAYYGVMDRRGKLFPDYVESALHFFEWMKSLNQKQFPELERHKGRVKPLFLEEGDKRAIEDQINRLKNSAFLSNEFNISNFIQYLVNSTRQLMDNKILSDDFDVFNTPQDIFS